MVKKIFFISGITIIFVFIFESIINYRELRIHHKIYHHDLSVSFNDKDVWGINTFNTCTDSNGFKIRCKDYGKKDTSKFFDLVFIGDSFTEAQEYEKSFVGIISRNNEDLRIANLGVASYSPSIYYYKIKNFIEKGYRFKHVVVYIDISDVQDEAIYQEFEGTIINKHILDFQDFMIKDKSFERKIKDLVKKNFPFVYSKLHKIKQKVSLEENNFIKLNKDNIIYDREFIRGSWTYNSNLIFRDKFSVNEMIDKNLDYMSRLKRLLLKNDIDLSIGIYPWPSQILWDTERNLSVKIWENFCIVNCKFFFNNNNYFFNQSKKTSKWETIKKYYLINDVHFNDAGNEILAKNFLSKYENN